MSNKMWGDITYPFQNFNGGFCRGPCNALLPKPLHGQQMASNTEIVCMLVIASCREETYVVSIRRPGHTLQRATWCCRNPNIYTHAQHTAWLLRVGVALGEYLIPLHWRHNDHGGVSNHQPHGCLLNLLVRRRSKKTSKLRVTGLCAGNSPGPVNSPHKGPVTRKMVPFDDVIMLRNSALQCIVKKSNANEEIISMA